MVLTLFGEIIHYIIEKSRHYDVSITRVRHGKDQVPSHLCADTGWQTRTGVAYPMQVIGLLPFMETGKRTQVHKHRQV